MTEKQRIKLEELIIDFEQVVLFTTEHRDKKYARKQRDLALKDITDHLDTIQRSETIFTLIYNWLQEEREEDNPYPTEKGFDEGILAGRVECAEGLIAQIDKWEQRISNQEEND